MKKRILTLVMAVALSFSTINTVVFAEETEVKTIIGSENETVNNLLEMARVSYGVCIYSDLLLDYIDLSNDWIYVPQEAKKERLEQVKETHSMISDFKQSIIELYNALEKGYGDVLVLSGDIETTKKSIQLMKSTCEDIEEVLSALEDYMVNDNWEGINLCKEVLWDIQENFNELDNAFETIFESYLDRALELSRQ